MNVRNRSLKERLFPRFRGDWSDHFERIYLKPKRGPRHQPKRKG